MHEAKIRLTYHPNEKLALYQYYGTSATLSYPHPSSQRSTFLKFAWFYAVVSHIFLNKINSACLWASENVILLYNLPFSFNVSFVKFTHVVYYSLNLLKLWSKDLCWYKTLSFQDKYKNRDKCLETAITSILTSLLRWSEELNNAEWG